MPRRKKPKPIVIPADLIPADQPSSVPAVRSAGAIVTFDDQARAWLAPDEYTALKKYIESGGFPIHTETAVKFFELFLNGYDCKEIHKLNAAFKVEMIYWAKVQYRWVEEREKYLVDLQLKIREKMIKTQLETSNFMADMLTAASRKYGNKIKKYLQTGEEDELGGALEIESIHQLVKLVEGLTKITGQDNVKHTKTVEERNINLNVTQGAVVPTDKGGSNDGLNEDEASQVLKVLAASKRRQERAPKT